MRLAEGNDEGNIEVENLKRPALRLKTARKKKQMKQSCPFCQCHLHQNLQISFASQQSLTSSSPRHAVFILLIPLLIGLLQVDYQNKNVSPFDTHPINMWIFFAAACIYCLGLTSINMEENYRFNYSKIISPVIFSSGSLASVSLASVFLPRLIGWLCLALWTLLPVMLAGHLIKHIHECLKHAIMKTISQACDRLGRFWGWLTLKNQQLPM